MCTYSMIMDHFYEKWQPYVQIVPMPVPSPITPAEIEEFRRLLQLARIYDRKHNEPYCELEEKKQKIKELARQLGVDVSFVDGDWQHTDAAAESQVTRDDRL